MKNTKNRSLTGLSLAGIFLCSSLCDTAHAIGFNAKAAKIESLPKRKFPVPGNAGKSLQNVVNDNAKKGAVITLAAGKNGGNRTYTFSEVVLPSNIHLRIPPSVTLKLGKGKRAMFRVGEKNKKSSNVTIQATGARFTVDFTNKKIAEEARFVLTQFADNVRIQNVTVKDNKSKFNAIEPAENVAGKFTKRLTVKNIIQTNANGGYGIIQVTRVTDADITNLNGKGGIPLRCETHAAKGNKGITDLRANGIVGTNGRAAVSLSPHTSDSIRVNITGVTSTGSSYGILAPNGFGKRIGKFTKTTVRNVKATYKNNTAQERLDKKARIMTNKAWSNFLKLNVVKNNNQKALERLGESLAGPSLAAIFTTKNKASGISYKGNLKFTGFNNAPARANEDNYVAGNVRSRRIKETN